MSQVLQKAFQLLLLSALIFLCLPASALDVGNGLTRVTFLQLNDVYGISPVDKGARGGLARVATLRSEILKSAPDAIFVLDGDTLSPSVASRAFQGSHMIQAWNALGLNIATLGNHEFDFGPEVLLKRMQESKFPWICANIYDKQSGKRFGGIAPFVIRNIDGIKVGIVGLLTRDTLDSSEPGPNVLITDPISEAQTVIPQMRAAGANVIVAMTHLSLPEDQRLARTGLVDLILGGHEHSVIESMAGHALILKVGSDARNLGLVEMTISKPTMAVQNVDWKLLPVDSSVKEDAPITALANQYEQKLQEQLGQTVAVTAVPLDGLDSANRSGETNLGDLVADAYRKATAADIALVNGGAIRAGQIIPAGPITRHDVISILPFEEPVVKLQISGTEVKKMLEHGVSADDQSGRFPQVSGLSFQYDPQRPAGSRILNVLIGGKPLDSNAKYTLATSSYLANGGDGYTMLCDKLFLIPPEAGPSQSVVLISELEKAKSIAPKTEGRIVRLDHHG